MGNILGYYLMPHPPVIVPDIGMGREKEIDSTSNACNKIKITVPNAINKVKSVDQTGFNLLKNYTINSIKSPYNNVKTVFDNI